MNKLISPEALTELLRIGWPRAVLPEAPSNTSGITLAGLGTTWQLFAASEYGIGRYEVSVPVGAPPERAFMLQFRLAQWRWQLAAVRVPESIRLLLAEEIIKSGKAFPIAVASRCSRRCGRDQSSSPSAPGTATGRRTPLSAALGAPRDPAWRRGDTEPVTD